MASGTSNVSGSHSPVFVVQPEGCRVSGVIAVIIAAVGLLFAGLLGGGIFGGGTMYLLAATLGFFSLPTFVLGLVFVFKTPKEVNKKESSSSSSSSSSESP